MNSNNCDYNSWLIQATSILLEDIPKICIPAPSPQSAHAGLTVKAIFIQLKKLCKKKDICKVYLK